MKIGRITCYGYSYAADTWYCDNLTGIHRLYHIHSGTGGCRHNGKDYAFVPGALYLIPYTRDFMPYTDNADPVLHTYADFELLPPIATREVLSAGPISDIVAAGALEVFDAGGYRMAEDPVAIAKFRSDEALRQVCTASMAYLVSYLVRVNGAAIIRDPTVLKALEIIHGRMHEPISVGLLAEECYMHRDSFIRRFAKEVGTTPYAYLKALRLQTARSLKAEGVSLSEIARQTGYSDTASLLHALKASHYGE